MIRIAAARLEFIADEVTVPVQLLTLIPLPPAPLEVFPVLLIEQSLIASAEFAAEMPLPPGVPQASLAYPP